MKLRIYLILASILILTLNACSSLEMDDLIPDSSVDYKREKQAERNLVVPPDLTSARINDRLRVPDLPSDTANYSEFEADRRVRGLTNVAAPLSSTSVLPENAQISVSRDGDIRWLTIAAPTDAVWDRVIDFWQDQGILLEEQDPQLGLMQTAWLENRANISRDFVTDRLRQVFGGLYETGLRDQYRVRFERLNRNTTEMYLTHYGMQEVLVENASGQGENTIWTPRERDPELEAVMLRRMMVFLGAADERARAQLVARGNRQQSPVQMVKSAQSVKLLIPERFDRAWRLTGLSLDRAGFAVEDRDRAAGIYYVRYNDPEAKSSTGGFWSSLKFWGEEEQERETQYQIQVQDTGNLVEVFVLNSQGEPDRTETATRIINLLREQLQ